VRVLAATVFHRLDFTAGPIAVDEISACIKLPQYAPTARGVPSVQLSSAFV
jgi:hypothetical protein